jgi:NADPH:quinone reductase-like Zn-dependent oxidoreductase
VIGWDAAGIVVEAGPQATLLKVGEVLPPIVSVVSIDRGGDDDHPARGKLRRR